MRSAAAAYASSSAILARPWRGQCFWRWMIKQSGLRPSEMRASRSSNNLMTVQFKRSSVPCARTVTPVPCPCVLSERGGKPAPAKGADLVNHHHHMLIKPSQSKAISFTRVAGPRAAIKLYCIHYSAEKRRPAPLSPPAASIILRKHLGKEIVPTAMMEVRNANRGYRVPASSEHQRNGMRSKYVIVARRNDLENDFYRRAEK